MKIIKSITSKLKYSSDSFAVFRRLASSVLICLLKEISYPSGTSGSFCHTSAFPGEHNHK